MYAVAGPQILNPRLAMHFLCASTRSLHLQLSSPSCPYLRKQSSLGTLVSGQAQHGLMPFGLSGVTCLLDVSGGEEAAAGAAGGGEGVAGADEELRR